MQMVDAHEYQAIESYPQGFAQTLEMLNLLSLKKIVDCFMAALLIYGIDIRLPMRVSHISPII